MSSEPTAASEHSYHYYRKFIIVESMIFLTTGLTSFISLIFIPRSITFFLTFAILNGIFGVTAGAVGLYFSIKDCWRLVKVVWVLAFGIGILNLMGIGVMMYLLIGYIEKGAPECDCGWDKFVYGIYVVYYVVEVFADLFEAFLAYLEIKHSWRYYKMKGEEMRNCQMKINEV